MANQPKKYKKFVATAATATLVASAIVPVASAKSFSDVPANNEFEPFIDALSDAGIINGYTDGTFKPGAKLTRGQVVKMLGRWVESNGTEIPTDWNSKQRFNDVPVNGADQELVKYAALVKDAGVFSGSNGNLLAGNNITRQQMAKVLNGAYEAVNGVSLVDLADNIDDKLVQDLGSSLQEFEGYIQALVDLEISTVSVFRPTENVTRAQFAKFLYNTINLEAVESAAVKAINNTTVEVTFDEKVEDIKALDFKIEGLEVKNAVVKLTDSKTVVLTTTPQTAGAEYVVSVNGNEVGKFTGISAVLPKSVKMITNSQQAVYGQQVTVKAEVTVEEGQSKAGIPLTFIIASNGVNATPKHIEAYTDENGVAQHTYTQYTGTEDKVTAYATAKADIRDASAKVYWANQIQLAVEEITAGNELANNTKKSYKVKGDKNATYYVAIKENHDINPDKITRVMVQDSLNQANPFVTPYELKTGATSFAKVVTNSKGEGTFTIYGTNLSATPIVYKPEATDLKYTSTALQAAAPTVKFSQVNALKLDVKAEGNADAAEYAQTPVKYNDNSVGGRAYTVTVTDKDGKIAPAGTVAYVTFKSTGMSSATTDNLYFSTDKADFTKVSANQVFSVVVGKEGKAQFRLAGKGATVFATPTVFLNTAGDLSPAKLDDADIQVTAETTYFKDAVVANAVLTVKDGTGANARVITSIAANKDAYFEYQSVDQNGFAYRPSRVTVPGGTITVFEPVYAADGVTVLYYQQKTITNSAQFANNFALAFDVTSTFGNAVVKDLNGTTLNASQNLGNTKTYILNSDNNGKAVIRVTSTTPGDVSVNVTGSGHILPTATAKVTFTSGVAPINVSGKVFKLNTVDKTFAVLTSQKEVGYYEYEKAELKYNGVAISEASFEGYLSAGATVVVTETADGAKTFNIIAVGTSSQVTSTEVTYDVAVDYLVAEAVANGNANLVINDAALKSVVPGGVLPASADVTVNTVGKIAIEFASDVTLPGNLTVNAPNADVKNSAVVTGDVNIQDVSSNSFVNAGTINGKVVITDTTGARFVNNGTVSGNVEIDTTGVVKLGGTIATLVVKQAASITTETGTTVTTLKTEGKGAEATYNSAKLSALVATSGTTTTKTTTNDSIEITFNENVAGANITISVGGTTGTVVAGSALNKLVATFAQGLTTNDTVTVTVTTPGSTTNPTGSTSTFEFTTTNGLTWSRKN